MCGWNIPMYETPLWCYIASFINTCNKIILMTSDILSLTPLNGHTHKITL